MSEVTTSGEPAVASPETVSAPTTPAPSFGSSRGSGLARGKRPSAPAPSTAVNKDAAPGAYQPTSIQVINHQREYKNPFAPEPIAPAAVETPAAQAEPAVAPAPVEQAAPAVPAAVATPVAAPAPVEASTPAPKPVDEPKPELNILPPEGKVRPAQSWEIGNDSTQPAANTNPRRENRPDFRPTRRSEQLPRTEEQNRVVPPARAEQPPQPQQPRNEFRPREPRREFSGERREPRTFEPKPTPAALEAKQSGFLGWLKGLFAGTPAAKTPVAPSQQRQDPRSDEGRRQDGGNRGGQQQNRGGRGRGGYRGENRGENRGPQAGPSPNPEGHAQGGERNPSERRFDDANRGGGRRHHRGGRGRSRGDNHGGGEHRSDGGNSAS